MCVSCGCKKYEDDHGDQRNITMTALRGASEAGKVSMTDVARNIDEAITETAGAGSRSAVGMQGGADAPVDYHGNTPTP